jgi:hypothetical protein
MNLDERSLCRNYKPGQPRHWLSQISGRVSQNTEAAFGTLVGSNGIAALWALALCNSQSKAARRFPNLGIKLEIPSVACEIYGKLERAAQTVS